MYEPFAPCLPMFTSKYIHEIEKDVKKPRKKRNKKPQTEQVGAGKRRRKPRAQQVGAGKSRKKSINTKKKQTMNQIFALRNISK